MTREVRMFGACSSSGWSQSRPADDADGGKRRRARRGCAAGDDGGARDRSGAGGPVHYCAGSSRPRGCDSGNGDAGFRAPSHCAPSRRAPSRRAGSRHASSRRGRARSHDVRNAGSACGRAGRALRARRGGRKIRCSRRRSCGGDRRRGGGSGRRADAARCRGRSRSFAARHHARSACSQGRRHGLPGCGGNARRHAAYGQGCAGRHCGLLRSARLRPRLARRSWLDHGRAIGHCAPSRAPRTMRSTSRRRPFPISVRARSVSRRIWPPPISPCRARS